MSPVDVVHIVKYICNFKRGATHRLDVSSFFLPIVVSCINYYGCVCVHGKFMYTNNILSNTCC